MFWQTYNLNDLKDIVQSNLCDRENFKIAVIDDQNISLIRKLKQHGYQITHFEDIEEIDRLSKYKIIICDIEGVGKKFGSKYQGGHLIQEINKHYPLKYLIAFSGRSFDMTYNKFFSLCDTVMEKRADISEWTGCIDQGISNLSNPIYTWRKARKLLLLTYTTQEVHKIEQAYLKTIIKKDGRHFGNVLNKHTYSDSIALLGAIGTYLSIFT